MKRENKLKLNDLLKEYPVYVVGSVLRKNSPRDIDLLCVIPDEKFKMNNEEKITIDDVKLFLNSVEKLCDVFQTINDFDVKHIADTFKKTYIELFPIESEFYNKNGQERQKEILQALYRIKYIKEFAYKTSKIEFQTK